MNPIRLQLFFLCLSLILTNKAYAQLSGTYTIDPGLSASASNYKDIQSALDDMVKGTRLDGGTANGSGVSGPVVFKIADGTYSGQWTIRAISGTSSNNTVTFTSKSGDSSKVVLEYTSTSKIFNDCVISVFGTSHVNIEDLTLRRSGNQLQGHVIYMYGSKDIRVRSCRLESPSLSVNPMINAIYVESKSDDSYEFLHNYISTGGGKGVVFFDYSTTYMNKLVFQGNILDSLHTGIYTSRADSIHVVDNYFNQVKDAISVDICNRNVVISGNYIYSSGGKGIYLYDGQAQYMYGSYVYNNFIYNGFIYVDRYPGLILLNNTVRFHHNGTTPVTAVRLSFNNYFYNNIVACTKGPAVLLQSYVVKDQIDNNCYYAVDGFSIKKSKTAPNYTIETFNNLKDWIKATASDSHSVATDPEFTSGTYHVRAVELNGTGDTLPSFVEKVDIEGKLRDSLKPDLGVYELQPYEKDLKIRDVFTSITNGCGDSTVKVYLALSNGGLQDLSGISLHAEASGDKSQTWNHTYSGTLASGRTDTIELSPSLNTFSGANYTIKAWLSHSSDTTHGNDTMSVEFRDLNTPTVPQLISGSQCHSGEVQLGSQSSAGTVIYWYANDSTKDPLHIGNTYKTPHLVDTTVFYAESVNVNSYRSEVGLFDTDTTSQGSLINLTVKANVMLDSFAVHTNSTSTVEVKMYYKPAATSFNDNDTLPQNWISLGTDVVQGQGYGLPTYVHPEKIISLEEGKKYNFYFVVEKGSFLYTDKNFTTFSKQGLMDLNTSRRTVRSFSKFLDGTWNGGFYYHIPYCHSKRSSVEAIILPLPSGAGIGLTQNSRGKMKAGTLASPDEICALDTLVYQLQSPGAYTDAEYGTAWELSHLQFSTAGGDTLIHNFIQPSSSAPGLISYAPGVNLSDSTIIIDVTVKSITTGCDSTFRRYIKVNALPEADYLTSDVCLGENNVFQNKSTPAVTVVSHVWDFGDGSTSTDRNPLHKYQQPGTYSAGLVIANTNGCIDSVRKQLTVFPVPAAGFSSSPGCLGQSLQFNDTSTVQGGQIVSRSWDFGDGSTSFQAAPVHTYHKSGKYNVSLKVTTSQGCRDSISRSFVVYTLPKGDFIFNNGCIGSKTQFRIQGVFPSYTYEWDFGDGDTLTGPDPLHLYAAPGKYPVRLVTTSNFGCMDTTWDTVTIYEKPVAHFSVNDTCPGSPLSFKNLSLSKDSITSYSWDFGDGKSSIQKEPAHTYAAQGTYEVSLGITTINGCTDTFRKSVTVHPLPVPAFSAEQACESMEVSFTDSSKGNIVSRLWDLGDGDTATAESPTHSYTSAGKYTVTLEVTTDKGCRALYQQEITVVQPPKADFTFTTDKYEAEFTAGDPGYDQYAWKFGDGGTSSQPDPQHTYAANGDYEVWLKVSDSRGCEDSVSKMVKIDVVGLPENKEEPQAFKVYPNPFNSTFTVSYTLRQRSHVRIVLYDMTGREIAMPMDRVAQPHGEYTFTFPAESLSASGIYILRLYVGEDVFSSRLIKY